MPLDERGLYAPADFSALRSRAFDAPRVNSGARALRAALRMPKRDKHGRRYRGRDRSLLGHGHHPAAEAERILLDEADRLGLGPAAIVQGRVGPPLEATFGVGLGAGVAQKDQDAPMVGPPARPPASAPRSNSHL